MSSLPAQPEANGPEQATEDRRDPTGSAGLLRKAGFDPAVPSNAAAARRGWIGASLQPVSLPKRLRYTVGQPSGRMVIDIVPGSPADQAGLQLGDVILSVDGIGVNGPRSLRSLLGPERFGRPSDICLVREGGLRHVTVIVKPELV